MSDRWAAAARRYQDRLIAEGYMDDPAPLRSPAAITAAADRLIGLVYRRWVTKGVPTHWRTILGDLGDLDSLTVAMALDAVVLAQLVTRTREVDGPWYSPTALTSEEVPDGQADG